MTERLTSLDRLIDSLSDGDMDLESLDRTELYEEWKREVDEIIAKKYGTEPW